MRISETRQRQLALLEEYNSQRRRYKEEQEHTKKAREAREAGRIYDKRTEETYESGEMIPAADSDAPVSCGGKRKAEAAEENTHQHKKLKTNTLEMSLSQETKEHLEDIMAKRIEGQPYQGTVRQGEYQRALEQKPKNPYASLKAARREQRSKAATPKKAATKRVGRGTEGRHGGSKYETVAKKTAVVKEVAKTSRKRKAGEDLEEVSAAVRDVAKEATSTIYKKRKTEAKAKAEAVVDTKPVEGGAKVSLGKKRKAADALEGDAAQAVVHGVDPPSAKKRRTEDEPVMETEPLKEKTTAPSGEKKAKKVKDDEGPCPSKPVASPAKLSNPKTPMQWFSGVNKTSGWGRSSFITTEIVTVKKAPGKGGSSGKAKRG